tara:strand:- start:107 stop:556 length:450 start_codon:yes stop_codon:yes gene_type:complete
MHKVLFVCTANIYRSRFSEEVYNHLIRKLNLPSEAFSAGLKVGEYVTRKIYSPALQQLHYYKIKPKRKDEFSVHIDELTLTNYDKIICLDEAEHRPIVNRNLRLKEIKIDYWDIVDEPMVSSSISLPKCYKMVEDLVKEVSKKFISPKV